MDRYVPHIYATYFHILNEKSYEWLESFDDDYDFIMVEVNLDKLTNTAIGSGYIGAQMHYVNNILDHRQESFFHLYSATTVSFDSFRNNINTHAQAIILFNTLAFPLLCREVNEKFTDIEHEFRFIALDLPFVEQSCQHHLFKEISLLGKTGIEYHGVFGPRLPPLLLANNKAMSTPEILLTEFLDQENGCIKSKSRFLPIDINQVSKNYCYIGNKRRCVEFIRKALQMMPEEKYVEQTKKCCYELDKIKDLVSFPSYIRVNYK